MRRLMAAAVLALSATTVGTALPATAGATPSAPAAAAATCGITWGSLPRVDGRYSGAPITNLRGGRHECYDRLVVDLGPGPVAGYDVRYVPQVVQDGSGAPIPLAGGAFLQVLVRAPGHDEAGRPTYAPPNRARAVDVTGYQTFRQVAWAGTFEGTSLVGLGVRARLPFRVLHLTGPGTGSRLVIDVAHRW